MRALLPVLFACAIPSAAQWELGGVAGYGAYRNGSIFSPGGKAAAGIRNRFTAGAIVGEDLYQYVSGELHYLYQDGDPFLSSPAGRSNIQGQSHAVHYDVLIHFAPRERRMRPFVAAGVGVKYFRVSGPAPDQQPLAQVGVLNQTNQLRALVTAGAGVKYDIRRHVRIRAEFLDYITPFPGKLIAPAPGGTARGILHQFSPMFGISGVF